MKIYVDTSAFYAVIDENDINHHSAAKAWTELLGQEVELVCSNYILIETIALLQHRLGIQAIRAFQEKIMPILLVDWVTHEVHELAMTTLLIAARPQLSLVDCASFECMWRLDIHTAFTYDPHFSEQGFDCLPTQADRKRL